MTSPTQRSLAKLRAEGWTAAIVEHWNSHARIRQDLFGFIDLLALRGGEVMAVQTTSGSNVAARVTKISDNPTLSLIREAGWTVHVHGWRKTKAGKAVRWQCRVVDLS